MYDPASSVPLSIGPRTVSTYGKTFEFNTSREREVAIREAKEYGRSRQETMQIQKRRPLTSREQVYGDIQLPQERTKPKIYAQPDAKPDHNHWRTRLDELRHQAAHTPAEKSRLRNRIAFAENMANEWSARHEAEQAMQNQPVADDLVRIRQHAYDAYEAARNNPRSTLADLMAHKKLVTLAFTEGLSAGVYWDAARSLLDPDDEVPTVEATPMNTPYQHQ